MAFFRWISGIFRFRDNRASSKAKSNELGEKIYRLWNERYDVRINVLSESVPENVKGSRCMNCCRRAATIQLVTKARLVLPCYKDYMVQISAQVLVSVSRWVMAKRFLTWFREMYGGSLPVFSREIDGVLQQAKLVEKFYSCLSSQILGPHVHHLLVGAGCPMAFWHLRYARKYEPEMMRSLFFVL